MNTNFYVQIDTRCAVVVCCIFGYEFKRKACGVCSGLKIRRYKTAVRRATLLDGGGIQGMYYTRRGADTVCFHIFYMRRIYDMYGLDILYDVYV